MSNLDLKACPICQECGSLVYQEVDLGDRTLISYECLDCASVLVWLGDDLWLDADRWAYHKIGRPALAYLLHRSITLTELEAMARGEGYPEPAAQPVSKPTPQTRPEPLTKDLQWKRQELAKDSGEGDLVVVDVGMEVDPEITHAEKVPKGVVVAEPLGEVDHAMPEVQPAAEQEPEPMVLAEDAPLVVPEPEPDLLVVAEPVPDVEHVLPVSESAAEPQPELMVLAEDAPLVVSEPEPDLLVVADPMPEVEHVLPVSESAAEPEPEPVVLAEDVPAVAGEVEPDSLVMAEPLLGVEPEAPADVAPPEVEPGFVVLAENVVWVVPEPEPDPLVLAERLPDIEDARPQEIEPLDRVVVPEELVRVRVMPAATLESAAQEEVPPESPTERQGVPESEPGEETEEGRPWLARVLEPRRRRPAVRAEPTVSNARPDAESKPQGMPETESTSRTEPVIEAERSWLARTLEPRRQHRQEVVTSSEEEVEAVLQAMTGAGVARASEVAPKPPRSKGWRERRSAAPDPVSRRSRGSPFLVISISFVFLCLVCGAASMIAWSMFGPSMERALGPVRQPVDGGAAGTTPAVSTGQLTEIPAPTATPAVLFQGLSESTTGDGAYHLTGEVLNTSEQNLRFVEVLATFFDSTGQPVGTGSTVVELGIVDMGSSAPFDLVLSEPPPELGNYQLRANYLTTGQSLLNLEVVRESSSYDEQGKLRITGEVRNPHDFAIGAPKVVVTYYDAKHTVMAVMTTFGVLSALEPGQGTTFEVLLADVPKDYHHYTLLTEAGRE